MQWLENLPWRRNRSSHAVKVRSVIHPFTLTGRAHHTGELEIPCDSMSSSKNPFSSSASGQDPSSTPEMASNSQGIAFVPLSSSTRFNQPQAVPPSNLQHGSRSTESQTSRSFEVNMDAHNGPVHQNISDGGVNNTNMNSYLPIRVAHPSMRKIVALRAVAGALCCISLG